MKLQETNIRLSPAALKSFKLQIMQHHIQWIKHGSKEIRQSPIEPSISTLWRYGNERSQAAKSMTCDFLRNKQNKLIQTNSNENQILMSIYRFIWYQNYLLKRSHKILIIFHEPFRANSAPSLDNVNPWGASSRLPSLEKSPAAVACGARCGPCLQYIRATGGSLWVRWFKRMQMLQ